MGTYLINGSKYKIDESIQGAELENTLAQLAGQTPDPRGAKIDSYLAETDSLLKLTPGTSARQLYQESRFEDSAVSKRGARGLAQVMPTTLKTLSSRAGRQLDPHNTDDALWMHRELMRENLAKFGNERDALAAYNAGWNKATWNNTETNNYIAKITGAGQKAAYTPFAQVREKVDPATLNQDKDWLRASALLYSLRQQRRQQFVGSDEELASWGKDFMGNFNSNTVDLARYAHDVTTNGTPEEQSAFLFMMDTYDNTEFSWEGAGRAAKGIVTDPVNLVGLGTLGLGTFGKVMASAAAKQGVKKALLTGLGRTGIAAGIEGSVFAGVDNTVRQNIETTAGRKDSFSLPELAGNMAVGAAAGAALGTAGDVLLSKAGPKVAQGVQALRDLMSGPRRAAEAPRIAPTGLPEATPAVTPEAAPVAAAGPATPSTGPRPGTVLSESEVEAATARKQQGRLWVDDLPPVTPANPEEAAKLLVPIRDTGLRSTPQSMAELTEAGGRVADQLRAMDDTTLHGVLEEVRWESRPLEETRVVARGVQMLEDELQIEQASIIKQLGTATGHEALELTQRLAAVEKRLVPLTLADDAFGSMAGSMLRQRQEGLPGVRGVSVESLMDDLGMSREAAEAEYVRLVGQAQQSRAAQQISERYDADIQRALNTGDTQEAAMLASMRQRELAAVVETEMPGAATFLQKANEFVISNVFTPTTLAINLIPAAAKTLVLPVARAMASNPLRLATRVELAASYSGMTATVGGAWRAAKAAFRYEQSLLTRGTGRIMEGELALTGRVAGVVRFFPRMLNATDEFLGQLNYNSFIAGRAAAEALAEGVSRGYTGKDLTDYVKLSSRVAMEEAYLQTDGDALIQPLVNKGVNLGLTGEDLFQYVEREAMRDPDALRHGSDQEALDFVRDVLYKRNFSGNGNASEAARDLEQAVNRRPGMKLLLGQLFFRTPIRVFEEGIRLTPGVQFLAPNFISDLRGANGQLRQVRAQAEAMTSLALTGAVLALYASGSITGDGAYDNWKAQRTGMDGPAPAPYTITMPDGSTWSYRNFDPVATPFKIIINGLERLDKLAIKQAQGEFVAKGAWDQALAYVTVGTTAIGAALRDANLVAGVDQGIKLFENLNDPEGKEGAWVKWMGEKMALAVPNTFHKIAKQNDPTLKDPVEFWQVVETKLAALHIDKEDVETSYSYDVLGEVREITDTGTLWNIFSTATPEERTRGHSQEHSKVMLELDRLQRETGAVFTPALKHKMTGDLDLRTILTGDKQETLYDRWQRNYRELRPDVILGALVDVPLPDGTFKFKQGKAQTIQNTINELRDAAFMQTLAQEQRIVDEVIDLQLGKAKAAAGVTDFLTVNK